MAEYKATGGCLCGGVKFELTELLAQTHTCHCSMCRKSIGADYATFGNLRCAQFKLLKEDTLRHYKSSKDMIRSFCGVCGASVFAKSLIPGITRVFVNVGTLDGDPGIAIGFHIFACDKAPWVNIDDGLPRSDGYELLDFDALRK